MAFNTLTVPPPELFNLNFIAVIINRQNYPPNLLGGRSPLPI